jgi:3(or 17)beta-hydroxysteroid dehydrogenase
MGRLDGKVALVTGAASGLGRATVLRLAEEGASVLCCDIDEAGGQAVAKEVGDRAFFLRHDVVSESDWEAAIATAQERFGGLHAVVNNAGIVVARAITETTVEQWRRVMSINAEGVFLGCKHAMIAMRESGGSIINLSSAAGLLGTPSFAAYSASKGAVRLLTKTVAGHCMLLGLPVRCNSIHPGGIDTPMTQGLGDASQGAGPDTLALMAKIMDTPSPLGEPNDIANLVVYLASDESKLMNGAELAIDGGMASI